MTQKEILTYINDVLVPTITDTDTANEISEFATKAIAALDKKAVSAKAYAAKKRAETDVLTQQIHDVLTDTPMTAVDIVALVPGEDVTRSKVQARLKKLVDAGIVVKSQINIAAEGEKKHMVMGYALAAN